MGFSLQFGNGSAFAQPQDLIALQRLGVALSPALDFDFFAEDPFYEAEGPGDDEGYVAHVEVGWSWWSNLQELARLRLGTTAAPHLQNIHAWNGVAIPAELEPLKLGTPTPPKPARKPSFLERIGLKKPADEGIDDVVAAAVQQYSGGSSQLHVVSSLALLRELDALVEALGLTGQDALAFYEEARDDDEEWCGKAMALIAQKFIRAGVERGYPVWFIK